MPDPSQFDLATPIPAAAIKEIHAETWEEFQAEAKHRYGAWAAQVFGHAHAKAQALRDLAAQKPTTPSLHHEEGPFFFIRVAIPLVICHYGWFQFHWSMDQRHITTPYVRTHETH